MKNKKNKIGFSLVELLVVVAIIGIISVTMAVSFSKAQISARDQRRIDDLKAIQNAAEQYFLLRGSYPPNTNMPWTGAGVNGQVILQAFPKDPKGNSYTYTPINNGYCACSTFMESGKFGNAGQTNQFPCDFQTAGVNYCVGAQQL
jgi:prepilin-type N-terminal cleavage/methylation domain-containing protein